MRLYWLNKNNRDIGYEVIVDNTINKNYNQELNSATVLISHQEELLDAEILDEVRLDNQYFCISSINTTQINPKEPYYDYEIQLVSQVKLLEGITLPNLKITKSERNLKIKDYIDIYLKLYSPKIRVKNGNSFDWQYKWSWDNLLNSAKFDVVCPEMQWNRPTLREVLDDLMMKVDCIATLDNNVLNYLDLTERKEGTINNICYVHSSKSLEDYVTELDMELQNVIQDDEEDVYNLTTNVEYTSFRCEDNYELTTDNLKIYTQQPIYRLKHLWMCFNIQVITTQGGFERYVEIDLCNLNDPTHQDYIFSLVKESKDWQVLPMEYRSIDFNTQSLWELSKRKNYTLHYTRGGREITGFEQANKVFWFISSAYLNDLLYGIAYDFKNRDIIEGIIQVGNPPIDTGFRDIAFKIEYESLAQTKFKAGKLLPYENSRTIIDNQTESYVSANRLGILEYLKINRLGNEVLRITANYDSINDVAELGTVYGDDYVVFQEEIAVNPNYVSVIYLLTKHYILKNYFTGVKAKIRSWRIENEDCLIRNDLNKYYFEFSFNDKQDNIENFVFANSSPDLMFSPLYLNTENDLIKAGFIKTYVENSVTIGDGAPVEGPLTLPEDIFIDEDDASFMYFCVEINSKVLGNAIVFSTSAKDNYSVGLGVGKNANAQALQANDDMQNDIRYVDDYGELLSVDLVLSNNVDYGEGKFVFPLVHSEFNSQMFADNKIDSDFYTLAKNKPLAYGEIIADDTITTNYVNLHKDSKEVLALSLQLEYCTDTPDIVFGSQFVKDNCLITNNFRKIYDDTVYPLEGELYIPGLFTTEPEPNENAVGKYIIAQYNHNYAICERADHSSAPTLLSIDTDYYFNETGVTNVPRTNSNNLNTYIAVHRRYAPNNASSQYQLRDISTTHEYNTYTGYKNFVEPGNNKLIAVKAIAAEEPSDTLNIYTTEIFKTSEQSEWARRVNATDSMTYLAAIDDLNDNSYHLYIYNGSSWIDTIDDLDTDVINARDIRKQYSYYYVWNPNSHNWDILSPTFAESYKFYVNGEIMNTTSIVSYYYINEDKYYIWNYYGQEWNIQTFNYQWRLYWGSYIGTLFVDVGSIDSSVTYQFNNNFYSWYTDKWINGNDYVWIPQSGNADGKYFIYKDVIYQCDVNDGLVVVGPATYRTGPREDLVMYASNEKVKIYDMNNLPINKTLCSNWSWSKTGNKLHIVLGTEGYEAYYICDSKDRVLLAFNNKNLDNISVDIYLNTLMSRNTNIYDSYGLIIKNLEDDI